MRTFLLSVLCFVGCAMTGLRGDAVVTPPAGVPVVPTLQLKSGRTLHRVRVMADEPDRIVVLATEGLVDLRKSDLPPTWAKRYPVRSPSAAESPDYSVVPAPRAPAADSAAGEAAQARHDAAVAAFKGCTITSFKARAFDSALGSAQVDVRNDGATAAALRAEDIVCQTGDGARHPGQYFVESPDAATPVVQRQEAIAAGGSLSVVVVFSNDALEVADVQWAKQP